MLGDEPTLSVIALVEKRTLQMLRFLALCATKETIMLWFAGSDDDEEESAWETQQMKKAAAQGKVRAGLRPLASHLLITGISLPNQRPDICQSLASHLPITSVTLVNH